MGILGFIGANGHRFSVCEFVAGFAYVPVPRVIHIYSICHSLASRVNMLSDRMH